MDSQQADRSPDLLEIAVGLSFFDDATAAELRAQAESSGQSGWEVLTRTGLLTASQLDILQTMQNPSEHVPGYQIEGLIGIGGMGVVFEARQRTLNRRVALKSVLVSQLAKSTGAARFEQEAVSVARLSHQNIVTAYDFGRHAGRLYLVMELVDGESLEGWIERYGATEEAIALSIARQVAAGLAHAADQGVVHRDIKPANLLLTAPPAGSALPSGTPLVKIADFGLAFLTTESKDYTDTRLTADGAMVGSPHYMAPEQFLGAEVDCRADVYALGATLLHLLSGQPPLADMNITQLLVEKTSGRRIPVYELLDGLAPKVVKLVDEMLDPEAEQRPGDYESLIGRLDQLLQEAPAPMRAYEIPSRSPVPSAQFVGSTAIHETMAGQSTGEMKVAASRGPISRRPIWVLGAIAMVMAALLVGVGFWPDAEPTAQRSHTEIIENVPLFDGRTLEGWNVGGNVVGGWTTGPAPDGTTSLHTISPTGAIGRPLPKWRTFRVSASLWLASADLIELQLTAPESDQQIGRLCVRLTATEVQVGRKQEDFGAFEPIGPPLPIRASIDRFQAVHVERQPDDWWIFFENDLVTTVPIDEEIPTQLRVVIENGSAWCAEISADRLAAPAGEAS